MSVQEGYKLDMEKYRLQTIKYAAMMVGSDEK